MLDVTITIKTKDRVINFVLLTETSNHGGVAIMVSFGIYERARRFDEFQ
jgi:hypothetical protein